MKDWPRIEVRSRGQLRAWLMKHHAQAGSIWLVTFRKSEGKLHVPAREVVEEALAFGWIDSLPRALDSWRTMRLLSPRRPGSSWSKVNKELVDVLTKRGDMHPSGLAKVTAAKADGSWSKLDAVETLAVPDDLARALAADHQAKENFGAFPPSTLRSILEWIENAKTAPTRERRIRETVEKARDNIRANQYRQVGGAG